MRKLDVTNKYQSNGLHDLDEVMDEFKKARKRLGLSQADVADLCGVSVSSISKFERGLYPTRVVWLATLFRVVGGKLTEVNNVSVPAESRWIGKVGENSPQKISDHPIPYPDCVAAGCPGHPYVL